jgi:hypothetical protein
MYSDKVDKFMRPFGSKATLYNDIQKTELFNTKDLALNDFKAQVIHDILILQKIHDSLILQKITP